MTAPGDPSLLARRVGARIGYRFRDTDNLILALTHVSADGGGGRNYERLEFLGDRILGLVIAAMLFETFPEADEGELSRRFNALVNAAALASVADEIGLHEFITTGMEMKNLQGRKRVNLRADVVESLIAAIFLDGGLKAAERFVRHFWHPRALASDAGRRDPKTELQEWAHRVSGQPPVYETESRAGPDHDPVFTVRAAVEGYPPEIGTGRTKREAEQQAAMAILLREQVWKEEEPGR